MIEASQEAEDAWVQAVLDRSDQPLDFLESCTPGYYNNEGHPNARAFRDGPYGGGSIAFVAMWEAWRAAGKLEGLELTA